MPGYYPTETSYQESVTSYGTGAPIAPVGIPFQGGYPGYGGGGYGGYGQGGYGRYCNPLGYCPNPKQSVNTRYYTYGIKDVQTRLFTPVRLTGVSGSGPGFATGIGAGAVYGAGGYGGYGGGGYGGVGY